MQPLPYMNYLFYSIFNIFIEFIEVHLIVFPFGKI